MTDHSDFTGASTAHEAPTAPSSEVASPASGGRERGHTDHVPCAVVDCPVVLCYCDTTDPCEGTENPGCEHKAAFVCGDDRMACDECRWDLQADRVIGWRS